MKKLLLALLIALAPAGALAREGWGDSCEDLRGPNTDRPDCLSYNPYYRGPGALGPTSSTGSVRAPAKRRVRR
jgi:hypothetical protein